MSEVPRHNGLDADPEGAFVYHDEYIALRDECERLREALEQLAILGNEPYYGNSDGNRIAQKALGIDPSAYMTTPAGGGHETTRP